MRDFCFLAENEASILAALKSVGLTIDDESGVTYALGDYCFAGPGRDGEGVYAVYRATNEQTAVILAARWPRGVSLVAPPSWLPRFGGQWLSPDTAQLRRAAYDRLDATAERLRQGMRKRWKHVMRHDPYYNPNLSYARPDFSLNHAPLVRKPWAR